ncbi:MAG: hypothetical protein GTO45_00895 [Candidatus Aminicenantes bacterium]|nr:hypothetical protein [Candidatus Aminicenantes bacterium]NIM77320.1 hypothetical protein [Candidatus Aminicenantes bacterium]NIN16621.1 hypothetical protein [Candidatus Aminicenantes bacterium]NIN40479.1 hypothetical protein [Candidatus Aminicenantes bacterium]NIN83299.1 hypothetical protein [Candidatus Aminicenantes bacterium]
MPVNPDFKDLFKLLKEEAVEYLVVGAHAVIFYAEPRYTKDLDIWVNPTLENARKVWKALLRFGAPLKDISIEDFTDPDVIYQIGVEPNRIDIIMGIAGVEFEDALKNRVISTYDGIEISIIGKSDLIIAKKAVGRKTDILDVERLEARKGTKT